MMAIGHLVFDVTFVGLAALFLVLWLSSRKPRRIDAPSELNDLLDEYKRTTDDLEKRLRELLTLAGAIERQPTERPVDYEKNDERTA